MNTQTKPITSWRELCSMFLEAMEWSNPATADPVGTAKYERLGNNVVRMTIIVDLVPRTLDSAIRHKNGTNLPNP